MRRDADVSDRIPQRFPFAVAAIVSAAIAFTGGRTANAQVPGEIRGRVTSRADGRVVSGARIDDPDAGFITTTDDDGVFILRGLAAGRHDIRVTAIGFQPGRTTVSVENGRAQDVSVVLDLVPARLAAVAVRGSVDSGGNATTIPRAQIDASGRQDLAGLLEQQAGVLVVRAGGPGAPAFLSLRGSSVNEVLVLVDGQPINSSLTGEADLSLIPLANIERITIIRGAQSAIYGPRALAGVVLIETRRPAGAELSAAATAGSWGERAGSISAGLDAPAIVGGVLTASRSTTAGDFVYDVPAVRGGGTGIRRNDAAALSSVSASVATEGPVAVAMHGAAVEDDRGLPGSVAAPDCCAHNGDTRASGGASVHSDRGLIAWTVNVDADHERTHYQDSEPAIPPAYDDRATATSVTATSAATLSGPVVTVTAGAEARTIGIAATELTTTAPSTEHDDGIYAHAHATHALGSGITGALDGAIRVDWNSLEPGTVRSPQVGVSVVRGPLLASVTTGESYNPPSLADQYFREGVLVRPNPNLKPERVRDEVEGRLQASDVAVGPARISSEIAVYRADITGMILWFPNFQFIWSPDNYNVDRAGWDANAEVAFPRWGLRIRGTVNDVSVDYAGPVLSGQIAYRPRLTVTAGAAITRGRVEAEITSRYIGDRRTVQGSALNALTSYWVTDIHATVHVVDGLWPLDVIAGVDDLLDRRTALLFDYPYPGRAVRVGVRLRYAHAH